MRKGCIAQHIKIGAMTVDFLTVQKVIESGKLGDLLELEMHFDYYRPEVPEKINHFDPAMSYLYGMVAIH